MEPAQVGRAARVRRAQRQRRGRPARHVPLPCALGRALDRRTRRPPTGFARRLRSRVGQQRRRRRWAR
eukprot:11225683-Lingulodinium_polyedra.AAC.1